MALHRAPPAGLSVASRVEVACARLAVGGKGVCFQDGSELVILVDRALPGERLTAQVTLVKKGYAEAVKVATLRPHNHAVPAPCAHHAHCGGCPLQSLDYSQQLVEKQNQVFQTLTRVGKLPGLSGIMQPILGCDVPIPTTLTTLNSQYSAPRFAAQPQQLTQTSPPSDAPTTLTTLNSQHSLHSPTSLPDSPTQPRQPTQMPPPSSSAAPSATAELPQLPQQQQQPQQRRFRYRNKLAFTFSSRRWDPTVQSISTDTQQAIGALRQGTDAQGDTMAAAHVLSQPAAQSASTDTQGTGGAQQGVIATGHVITQPTVQLPSTDTQGGVSAGHVTTQPTVGFLRPGSAEDVLPIQDCLLAPHTFTAIMHTTAQAVFNTGLLPANDPTGKGCLVSMVVRRGSRAWAAGDAAPPPLPPTQAGACDDSGRYVVTIVTTPAADTAVLRAAAAEIVSAVPCVAGVAHRVVGAVATSTAHTSSKSRAAGSHSSRKRTNASNRQAIQATSTTTATGLQSKQRIDTGPRDRLQDRSQIGSDTEDESAGIDTQILSGTGYLLERLCGLWFRISPGSFFQTNAAQTEVLYDVVSRAAALQPTDTLLDLYCGIGTIGLSLASQCRHVLGYEAIESAIADAKFNAELNGITNASFVCGDLQRGLQRPGKDQSNNADKSGVATAWQRPNVVVVNPARAGLSEAVVDYLQRCGARRVVYVSCNPATQARDLRRLCGVDDTQRGSQRFRLTSVQPVDMFPHTDHVENVAVLDRAL